ncbi:DUF1579 domain-containing protein [Planctomicrobium sp. SH661]|uniref:DUF1579 domain-containing protein n=1 Tax=Planctomicrobium sp. SH661 TaxID=3448124 RepID=UPI003F5B143C
MFAKPQEQHAWLNKLVGEWRSEMECSMGPDQPPMKHTGREVVRSLGGLWVICEGTAEMPEGGTAVNIMTLGFDPDQGRYVGTFVASVMTYLWVYSGEVDSTGNSLILDTVGPSFSGSGTAQYKDSIIFVSDDHRMLTSQALQPDGTWMQFMTANYYRVKSS